MPHWKIEYDDVARLWSWSRVADAGNVISQSSRRFRFFDELSRDARAHGCGEVLYFSVPPHMTGGEQPYRTPKIKIRR